MDKYYKDEPKVNIFYSAIPAVIVASNNMRHFLKLNFIYQEIVPSTSKLKKIYNFMRKHHIPLYYSLERRIPDPRG